MYKCTVTVLNKSLSQTKVAYMSRNLFTTKQHFVLVTLNVILRITLNKSQFARVHSNRAFSVNITSLIHIIIINQSPDLLFNHFKKLFSSNETGLTLLG